MHGRNRCVKIKAAYERKSTQSQEECGRGQVAKPHRVFREFCNANTGKNIRKTCQNKAYIAKEKKQIPSFPQVERSNDKEEEN